MKPTLLILAAGMGSRYGGLKQIDGIGPNGEAIIEYSIYDAIRAGFGKIVFVIRKDIEDAFKAYFADKFQSQIEVAYVFQELSDVPAGVAYNPERVKPWGTGHAVLMGKDAIDTPLAMINADDFYGAIAFQQMADFLRGMPAQIQPAYCIVGYKLNNTLSKHGSVSRGECVTDQEDYLLSVSERTKIERNAQGQIEYQKEDGSTVHLAEDTIVSMNMIGFPATVFPHLEHYFEGFLRARGQELKSEYYIPTLLSDLINDDKEKVKVVPTDANWFGVTYREDKEFVVEQVQQLINGGVYPAHLWN